MQWNKKTKYADIIICQGHFYCGTVITEHVTDMVKAVQLQLQVLLFSSQAHFLWDLFKTKISLEKSLLSVSFKSNFFNTKA